MDNKNHFESKVSDFLEALRKAGYSESTIRQYKKTCRLFIVYMDVDAHIVHHGQVSGLRPGPPGRHHPGKRPALGWGALRRRIAHYALSA